ncbi:FAD-dependent oxidoreductase [Rathayibacter sp. YIM 133350]|uniref:NAD(P)/FAD-dependent oxidoreductase n=1 Tax=Rathayibacter sp. YIM 133350 TaxID=3131992 RepID=UPI00307E3122
MSIHEPIVAAVVRVHLYGTRYSREAYAIRDFLTRSVVDFAWTLIETDEQCRQATGAPLAGAALPLVVFPDGSRVAEPTLAEIAARLGWITRPRLTEYDLSIYGAGPAGLSAAVYAASEGLSVVLVEKEAVGGQAGSSSLIENYLGFPHGIPGAELAEHARQQAVSFGADLLMMREGVKGVFSENRLRATLADGSTLVAKSNICATGVEWRRLGLPGEQALLGVGLYYGAGTSEASQCAGEHVYVVGGANSAGQAVMNMAAHAERVTMLVRGPALSDTLSSYLESRIVAQPNVDVQLNSRITALAGTERLEGITVENTLTGGVQQLEASRVFVCIGGAPDTDWATDTAIVRDRLGFMVTGPDLTAADLDAAQWPLARAPFYLETSVPGSFAAGDVRHHSIKRVASAVGEGAMAVTFAHRYLSENA